jgi:hypothetical protein
VLGEERERWKGDYFGRCEMPVRLAFVGTKDQSNQGDNHFYTHRTKFGHLVGRRDSQAKINLIFRGRFETTCNPNP